MNRMKRVYLVIQHQTSDVEYDNRTVYVCETYAIAEYAAIKLNKRYAENVILDEDNLFVDIKDETKDSHYYTIESYAVEQSEQDIDEYAI